MRLAAVVVLGIAILITGVTALMAAPCGPLGDASADEIIFVAMPTDLHATGANNNVTVSWTASSSPGVTGYEVRRWNNVTQEVILITSGTVTTVVDHVPELTGATYYTYNVTAVTPTGRSSATADVLVGGPVEEAPSAAFIYPYEGAINTTGSIDFVVYASDNGSGLGQHSWALYLEGVAIDSGYLNNNPNIDDNLYLNLSMTGLVDGNYTFEDILYDFAGNVVTNQVHFKIDKTAPSVAITHPGNGSFIRSWPIDLTWAGSDGVAGIKNYSYRFDGGAWYENGRFTYVTMGKPPQGDHTFTVRAYDHAGWMSSASTTFTFDSIAPIIELGTTSVEMSGETLVYWCPDNGAAVGSADNWIGLSFTTNGTGSAIALLQTNLDGLGWVTENSIVSIGNSFTIEGNHSIAIRAYDQAGNQATVVRWFYVDLHDPLINITAPAFASGHNTSSVTVQWEGYDALSGIDRYEWSTDNSNWNNVSTLTQHTLTDLTPGTYNFYIRAVDRAGRIGVPTPTSVTFTVDLTAPTISILTPLEGHIFNVSSVVVQLLLEDEDGGSGLDTSALRYKYFRTENGEPPGWSTYYYVGVQTLSLPMNSDGNYTLLFEGQDNAGNTARDLVNFTVDTTAPLLGLVFPSEGAATNDVMPVISWNGADATTGISYYLVSIDGGPWQNQSANVSMDLSPLNEGAHNVSIMAVDHAGWSTLALSNFTIDITAPEVDLIAPIGNTWVGSATVYIAWNAWDNQSGIAQRQYRVDNGSWTTVVNNEGAVVVADGAHHIEVWVMDNAGNFQVVGAYVYVDTAAPDFDMVLPVDGSIFTDSTLAFSWTSASDEGSGLASYAARVRNDTVTGVWTPFGPSTHNAWSTDLADGIWIVDVKAIDNVGNERVVSRNVHIDLHGPWITFNAPLEGGFTNSTSISWSAQDNGTWVVSFSYSLNGLAGPWQTIGNVSTCQLVGPAQGSNTVTLRGQDAAGNHGYANLTFVYDTVDPSLVIDRPSPGAFLNKPNVVLEWTASDPVSGIDHYDLTLLREGSVFVHQAVNINGLVYAGLEDGNYTMIVVAYDGAGNTRSASVTFTVDTIKPLIAIVSPEEHAFVNGTVLVQWISSDQLSLMDHFLISVDSTAAVNVGTNTSWSFVPSDGPHVIRVRAVDHAGNAADAYLNITVDNILPALSITAPAEGLLTSSRSVTMTWTGNGTGSAIDRYEVRIDGGPWAAVGNSLIHTFKSLIDGPHTLSVRAYDQVGQYAERSVIVTVDATAPTISSHGSTGDNVSLGAVMTVTFSEPMDHAVTSITMQGVVGVLFWSGNTLMFDPVNNLAGGQSYTVSVDGKDLAGNPVHYQWVISTTTYGTLTGRVLDENGQPIAGAQVVLDNGTATTTTDADGFFSFDVPPGWYTLTIIMSGFDTIVQKVEVTSGQGNDTGATLPPVTLVKSKAPDLSTVIAIVAVAALAAIGILYVIVRKRAPKKP